MNRFMEIAIKEANKGLTNNEGGPFGAVIVKNGKIITKGHNKVIKTNDPTSHAEINVIKEASKKLKRFDLSGCEIYSTCEPCPMCLSAIYWAKIKKVYYGCTRKDAEKIGFADNFIYEALNEKSKGKRVKSVSIDRAESLVPFKKWEEKKDKVRY